jgi:hypothetical protein
LLKQHPHLRFPGRALYPEKLTSELIFVRILGRLGHPS